jgi:chorismate mutase
MDYARQQGPLLAETLKNVATAAVHLLTAASGVGVSVLQLANAAAKLVASLPPGFITVLMQTAIAIRAVKLAGSGIQLLAGGFSTVASSITTMRTAAAGASGRVAGLRSALGSLSTGAKLNVAAVGIGLLAVAFVNLSKIGKQAPPDVDKLTTSLGNLARTGKTSGEAARVFGSNLKGLYDGIRNITDASTTDKIQQGLVKVFSLGMADSTPNTEAKQKIDAIDKSLASLVQGGKADVAAEALKRLAASYAKGGHDAGDFTNRLDKYKSALADQKFEQDLAAQSMGLFGAQAQKTQAALAEQQRSADGLRQSIMALNEAHRSAFDADTKFAAAIDNVAKSLKDNGKTLDINTEKGRANRDALSQLASATEESAAQARANGASWSTVSGIYDKGRKSLIDNAYAITGNRKEAKALADQLLRTPDKTARLKGNLDDLKSKLDEAAKRLKNAPSSKQTAIRGNIDDLKFKISEAQRRLNAIDGKTAVTYVVMKTTTSNAGTVFHEGGNYASGGPIGFPGGGPISGPGTGTSDSIPIMASNGEYVINARSTAKYRSLIEAINAGTLGGGRGMPGAGAAVAQGLMSGMAGATSGVGTAARTMAAAVVAGVKGELQIASPSKKMKALAADIGKGLIVGLTGSQAKIKSVAADLAKDIRTAFSGKKESHLVAYVNKQTGKLLAAAKKRDAIAAKIAEARKYASDVTTAARESAGLSNLGMEPEQVTAGGIKAGLAGKLAQINQFTKYIGILAKKGLSKGLLRQILDMGPDAGYAYASALVGADKATFASINKTQNAVDKASTALGRSGADILYDSGKQAGKGFLKGLEGQQKDIEKLMMSIAKGMQKAIKKALGIKSPSTVMAQLGRYSTQGLARGLVDGVPVLDRALDVVTGRVAGAQPVIGRPAVRAGGGGVVINLTVEVRPGADAQAVWREIRQGLLSLKRGNGGGSLGLA